MQKPLDSTDLETQIHDFLNLTTLLRDIMEIAPPLNDITQQLSETESKTLKRTITPLCRFDIDRIHNRLSAINRELFEIRHPI